MSVTDISARKNLIANHSQRAHRRQVASVSPPMSDGLIMRNVTTVCLATRGQPCCSRADAL